MKLHALVAAAALVSSAFSAMAAPTPPIASVSCTAGVTGCARAADGISPTSGQDWRALNNTAWWTSTADVVTFNLDGARQLTGLTAWLDNNDTYTFQYQTGSGWSDLVTIPFTEGAVTNGMDVFTKTFAPVTTSAVRVFATYGDEGRNYAFSVGEVSFAVAAVPEPGTVAMLAAGLGMVGFVGARRRREQR